MPRRSPAFLLVHAVWATSRRRPILPVAFDASLAAILGSKARDIGCILLAAGVASDHVHVLVRLGASVALSDLIQRLKGGSAYDTNQRLLVSTHLEWQAGYWAESVSPADTTPLVAYFQRQRIHHDDSHPAERWLAADE